MMRLSTFIAENTEQILSEWVEFAHGLPGCETMDVDALRDHAKEMLVVIQQDLDTPQSNRDQADKSKGKSDANGRRLNPAQEHGAGRAESGFTVGQMLAEFRALRATVIRLWTKAQPQCGVEELEDLTRFNEAIDQAVAESVSLYTQNIERSKEMFLAILGHDLRSPLGAVLTSAQFMLENVSLAEPSLTLTTRIASSAKRMNHMIGDLLDFTRGRFGDGMPIDRSDIDLSKVCRAVVDEVAASHADRTIALETIGDLRDSLDGDRVAQALANLVNNALHHGSPTSLVLVRALGKPDELVISVHNTGPVIPKDQVKRIFGAMTHVPTSGQRDRRHLGLGLYIVEQIVTGHRGTVGVESTAQHGTTFTIHLPRASRTTQASRAGEKPALALV